LTVIFRENLCGLSILSTFVWTAVRSVADGVVVSRARDREFVEKDLAKVQTFGVGLSYDPAVGSREYTIAVGMSEPLLRLAGLGLR